MSFIPMNTSGGGTETTYTDGSEWSYTSNCTYLYGGLYKTGRIVQIVLGIKVNVAGDTTSNPPLLQINKIPYTPSSDASSSAFRFTAHGPWKSYNKEIQGYLQRNTDLTQNGLRISLCNPNIAANDELKINFTFICD